LIRGIHISRFHVSGIITLVLFTMRACSVWTWSKHWAYPITEFFTTPLVAFIMLMVAAVIITYPWLTGAKALFIAPTITLFVGFFVYTYYVI